MNFETPGPVEEQLSAAISPIEDIIPEARAAGYLEAGRYFASANHG